MEEKEKATTKLEETSQNGESQSLTISRSHPTQNQGTKMISHGTTAAKNQVGIMMDNGYATSHGSVNWTKE